MNEPPPGTHDTHGLRKTLGLRDLVPMQVLMVCGLTWAGIAARQGATHVIFWLLAVLLLFLPVAGVIHYCVKIWPLEGGVYQWTRHAIGPFAGFLSAWNFGIWAIFTVSGLGITTAAALSYSLGSGAAWMAQSNAFIGALNIVLLTLILIINIPGLGIGRWVAHFGTAVTILITCLLGVLIVFHPHTSPAHPYHAPQAPFALSIPVLTILSLNLFSKISLFGLSGLEQVAVFAGETRGGGTTILRSAWIAAPVIMLIYVCMTGSMLCYTPAAQIDLTAPIPQVLSAAFASGNGSGAGPDMGLLLGRGAILVLAVATVAQYAVVVAETSRLPMVAAWDHLLPAWFTRLHPRFRTPTRSLLVIVALCLLFGLAASTGAGAQEAFQVVSVAGNVSYAIYYILMFSVPLVAGKRFGHRPGVILIMGCIAAMLVTLLSMGFSLYPIVDVSNPGAFAMKIVVATLLVNLCGAALYWRGARAASHAARYPDQAPAR